MGIQLHSGKKEIATLSTPSPSEQGAHRFRVIFYCVDEGHEPALALDRNWQSSEQFFSTGIEVFTFSKELSAQHGRECQARTHRIDYEVTVVRAE